MNFVLERSQYENAIIEVKNSLENAMITTVNQLNPLINIRKIQRTQIITSTRTEMQHDNTREMITTWKKTVDSSTNISDMVQSLPTYNITVNGVKMIAMVHRINYETVKCHKWEYHK